VPAELKKGLEISCIALVDRTLNTAFAIEATQSKAPRSKTEKIKGYETSITHALEALKTQISTFKLMNVTSLVADGWYAKNNFICGVTTLKLHVVSKLRSDANLKYIFTGVNSGRGRPRQFGEKVDLTELSNFDMIELDKGLVGYSKIVHSVAFKRKIKIVVLRRKDDAKNLAILFSTNLNECAVEIVSIYGSRFQIEFLFRDAKQYCGLEDCQARNETALYNHFNTALTAVNLMKFEELQMGQAQSKQVISIASARRRKSNQFVANFIFSKLDQELSCSKKSEIMNYIENISDIAA